MRGVASPCWGGVVFLVCVAKPDTSHADDTGCPRGFLGCCAQEALGGDGLQGPREGHGEWGAPKGLRWRFPNSPLSCPSVLYAVGLARSLFDRLWEVCSQWQKQVPVTARVPQRQWLVSVHAIRNARRRMEDRHVCLPAFNLLFGLSVSALPGQGGPGGKGESARSGEDPGCRAGLPAGAETGGMTTAAVRGPGPSTPGPGQPPAPGFPG